MKYKFNLQLGQWRMTSNLLPSQLDLYSEEVDCKESGRFYFIHKIQLKQENVTCNDIVINGWHFQSYYEVHDGKECWAKQDTVKEKYSIRTISPTGDVGTVYVNDTIDDMDVMENIVNTLYVISFCNNISEANVMSVFIHDKGLMSSSTPDYYFTLLMEVKRFIQRCQNNQEPIEVDFLNWLKRIYIKKYKVIVEKLYIIGPKI